MFSRLIVICLILLGAIGAAFMPEQPGESSLLSRPRDPWVFAGSLDDRPRILFVALHHDLWLAYDTELGDVYKAWRGALQPQTEDPHAFSPWPATIEGLTYFARSDQAPWRVIRNGVVSTPEVLYRGYRLTGDRLSIKYELLTEYGDRISVEETPEIVHDEAGRPGLQREFFLDQIPSGFQLAIDVEATTLKNKNDVQSNGIMQRQGARTHSFVWGKTYDLAGRLLLEPGAATTLTTYFTPNLLKNLENETALDPLELFKHTEVYQAINQGDKNSVASRLIRRQDHVPGASVKVYGIGESIDSLMQLAPGQLPTAHTIESSINLTTKEHFGDLDFYFITHVSGFFNIASEGSYSFQLLADDGVRFIFNDAVLYEHNGLQAARPSEDIEIELRPGVYPFVIEHFQSTGRKRLTLNWKPPWKNEYEIVSAPTISTKREEQRRYSAGKKHILRQVPEALISLGQIPVNSLHPGIDVLVHEVEGLEGMVGGMDYLSDGRLVLSTWKGEGTVYVIEGLSDNGTRPQAIPVAKGLAYPLGVKTIDDEIFVLQKHELTQLIDLDGDQVIDEYRVVANSWPITNDFEELTFGLVYREGEFYAGLAVPVDENGAILIEELPDRGHIVRIGFDGSVEKISGGYQLLNGLELDKNGTLATVDHRNPWFSDSRLLLAGGGQKVFEPASASQSNPLSVSSLWLPSGSKTEAPTQPVRMFKGPFAGQWIYGDLNHGLLNRAFIENVDGVLQGAVFRFTMGLPYPVNRLVVQEDGSIVAGSANFEKPWQSLKETRPALQQISFSEKNVFEMREISVKPDGFEIKFSQPIDKERANRSAAFRIYHWLSNESNNRQRRDRSIVAEAEVTAVRLSEDGYTARIELSEMEAGRIYYINLDPHLESEAGESLWSNEAWYSINILPQNVVGKVDH